MHVIVDNLAPTVTKVGDGTSDYELPLIDTDLYGTTINFSETLSTSGKLKVLNALTAGSSKPLTFRWGTGPLSNKLRMSYSGATTATFPNDVYATGVTDLAGNTATGLLIVDSAPSSIATVSSETYTVNNTGSTIQNIAYNTSSGAFLASLAKDESHEVWTLTGLSSPVVSGNTLLVTAEDGSTKTYTLTVRSAPSGGGGGGGSLIMFDSCPGGDFSGNYYDGKCAKSSTGSGSVTSGSGKTSSGSSVSNGASGSTSGGTSGGTTSSGTTSSGSINNSQYLFIDIADSFARDDIQSLALSGIVHGYTDKTFRPDTGATRAEYLAMVMRALAVKIGTGTTTDYTDIPADGAWMIPYLTKAKELGIAAGQTSSGSKLIFRPNDTISRAEALSILLNAAKIATSSGTTTDYTDIPTDGAWMIPYLAKAKELGIAAGQVSPDGKLIFRPNDSVTRAEAVKMIMKTLRYLAGIK